MVNSQSAVTIRNDVARVTVSHRALLRSRIGRGGVRGGALKNEPRNPDLRGRDESMPSGKAEGQEAPSGSQCTFKSICSKVHLAASCFVELLDVSG